MATGQAPQREVGEILRIERILENEVERAMERLGGIPSEAIENAERQRACAALLLALERFSAFILKGKVPEDLNGARTSDHQNWKRRTSL
jgi:hypothetical protein